MGRMDPSIKLKLLPEEREKMDMEKNGRHFHHR